MTCPYAHLDASYVLGALSPVERASFEEHLRSCKDCAKSVQRLAGLPGLLRRVPAETLEQGTEATPMPALLPALVRAARRHRRRRDLAAAGLAAAATTLLLVVGSAFFEYPADEPAEPGDGPPPAQVLDRPRLAPDHEALTDASLAYATVLWGTRLDLTCTYSSTFRAPPDGTYSLVVRTTDGEVMQVGNWRPLPGKTMTITAATAAAAEDISSIEVQTGTGFPVARWGG